MTQQNTMPDEIWADSFNDWYSRDILDEDPIGFKRTKYIRADLHTDLLKQAYKQIDILSNLITVDNLTQQMMFKNAQKVMKQIDKALGETK